MNLLNVGGTLTGGSTVAYTPAGVSPGKSVFVGPNHSRTRTDQFSLTASQTPPNTKTGAAGQGRVGTQLLQLIPVAAEEGCCTTKVASFQVDTSVKTSSDFTDAQVDTSIDLYRALVMTAEWKNAVKKLILASA